MDGYDTGLATAQFTRGTVAIGLGRPPMDKFKFSIQEEVGSQENAIFEGS